MENKQAFPVEVVETALNSVNTTINTCLNDPAIPGQFKVGVRVCLAWVVACLDFYSGIELSLETETEVKAHE